MGFTATAAGYESIMSDEKSAGDGVTDDEMVEQVNKQTDSELQQRDFFEREADGTKYRLLGVGISNLAPAHQADPLDLIDRGADKRAAAERAMDKLRGKFGGEAVGKGRGLRLETKPIKK